MRCKTCGTLNVESNPKLKHYIAFGQDEDDTFYILNVHNKTEALGKFRRYWKDQDFDEYLNKSYKEYTIEEMYNIVE